MIKPYVLKSPSYDPTSGGIKVMYGLYGWLLAKGLPAFLNQQVQGAESIGIYPEIYHGNDLFASKVIRYILQKPGMMGTPDEYGRIVQGPTSFDPKDEIYVFSKIYDEWNVPDERILFLPVISLYIFKDMKKKRTKTAFYVGKGVNWGKHPQDSIEINRMNAFDQQWLAETLNECETIYVYDHLSAIMEVARLCGTKVIYYGDMPEKQLKLYEPGMNGLGYKKEEKLNIGEFRKHYINLIKIFEKRLDQFIEETQ